MQSIERSQRACSWASRASNASAAGAARAPFGRKQFNDYRRALRLRHAAEACACGRTKAAAVTSVIEASVKPASS